jgi:putative cardiolipin synthase
MAEKSLDLQYYIWKDDLTGLILIQAIKEAAERGVRVRLLLDNLNESKLQDELKIFSEHPDVEVRVVNPDFKFINHRMHNKAFIADNTMAIVGGRNVGNEYFNGSKEINFTDFDVMLMGPVVNEVSQEFDLYWNSKRSFPIEEIVQRQMTQKDYEKVRDRIIKFEHESEKSSYIKELNSTKLDLHPYWGQANALYDQPSKLTGDSGNNILLNVRSIFKDVQRELILISPYFIPGKQGVKNLAKLHKHGVRIIVLTNSLASNDVSTVFGGYRRYREDLLKAGIELYEMRPQGRLPKKKNHFHSSGSMGLHGKAIIADRKKLFVGSMNLDSRSRDLNTEMGIIIENEALAIHSAEQVLKALSSVAYKLVLKENQIKWIEEKNNKTKSFDVDPNTTWWKRSKTWFFSLFIPESLL